MTKDRQQLLTSEQAGVQANMGYYNDDLDRLQELITRVEDDETRAALSNKVDNMRRWARELAYYGLRLGLKGGTMPPEGEDPKR